MNTNDFIDTEDVGEAIREGRPLRPARAFRILFAKENLDFSPLEVTDPVPLGRQVLDAAGLDPRDGYSLFAILSSGDFEDVRLDEPFDLRGNGAEREALKCGSQPLLPPVDPILNEPKVRRGRCW